MRSFHYILLEIKLEQGLVIFLDSRLPKKLQFRHPKVSTIVACSTHLLVIKALVSSIPFSMLANYQFD